MDSRPLVIELFCGRFGWSRGFVAEGFRSVGFDILHESYHGEVPEHCELVLQDVLTLHGAQFRDAAAIVASPPCQRYSWMAMPWDLAKREIRWQEWQRDSQFSPGFDLNDLFNACFRIQREASKAAGHHIPMVVENVKGAQRWVGRAAWHFGSFYLYGDVPALMPYSGKRRKSQHTPLVDTPDGTGKTSWFFGNSKHEGRFYGKKNDGGSWFAQAHNTESGHSQNPVNGVKVPSGSGRRTDVGNGVRFNSRSDSRKAASAAIAEIPFELASWVAKCLLP